ncbi:hypothetical protein AMELA_G00174350 [Ameiurus melas]|uniref:Uncharacterized protein n=1 Tax=Ameiurus melas TaxID=219545 RepID=A0A7J6ACX9_AMEME|nr:hypothetical protein AMELA_G00174350 [Ameiurus melas]
MKRNIDFHLPLDCGCVLNQTERLKPQETFTGSWGTWSPSQGASGTRQGTPWTWC